MSNISTWGEEEARCLINIWFVDFVESVGKNCTFCEREDNTLKSDARPSTEQSLQVPGDAGRSHMYFFNAHQMFTMQQKQTADQNTLM